MAMSDPIADMLTRIRNANKAKFNSVDIPGSNFEDGHGRCAEERRLYPQL